MTTERRKLRVLVISMGGPRMKAIETMFSSFADDFDPPVFCPGIPARSIRARSELFRVAHEIGLVPSIEWEALQDGFKNPLYQAHPNRFFECLQHVPVVDTTSVTLGQRMGSASDVQVHYSVELWRKSKGLNRGRSVLACLLAHLQAMKRLVDQDFDLIVEDNVRLCHDAARRIWETKEASELEECHLRYYGWLGSLPNLEWVFDVHSERSGLSNAHDKAFRFPVPEDFHDVDDSAGCKGVEHSHSSQSTAHQTPGGTPIWGAYSYWISKTGFEALLQRLRCDVGAMLWKGKRMRTYTVKPIDKVMPRQIVALLGRSAVHVTRQPAMFRAPMLPSKIHAQWDPEFCKSTHYQLARTDLSWNDVWLTPLEQKIVDRHEASGEWCTVSQMQDNSGQEETEEN